MNLMELLSRKKTVILRSLAIVTVVTNCVCSQTMDGLGSLFGAMEQLAAGVTCEYECPNGAEPIKNVNHVPQSNGCGSYGFRLEIDSFPDLQPCCDSHDMCYDTCGNAKSTCDNDFNLCLSKACKRMNKRGVLSDKEYKGCKATASLLHGGLIALGCDAYQKAQQNACTCPSKLRKDHIEL